ncbi:hypothetical protein [Acinetobacter sp.]|uniref:hypothetical protein n=1 Tax=Acinetobacter sp. TaxID=472 RepID=UPI003D01FB6D
MSEELKTQEVETSNEVELPLFEGGPTQKQIDDWKEKYGHIEMVEIAGEVYIYRQLGRSEHRTLLSSGAFNVEDTDEVTAKILLLFPSYKSVDWDKLGAGVIATLAQNMMRLSGFSASSVPIKL